MMICIMSDKVMPCHDAMEADVRQNRVSQGEGWDGRVTFLAGLLLLLLLLLLCCCSKVLQDGRN